MVKLDIYICYMILKLLMLSSSRLVCTLGNPFGDGQLDHLPCNSRGWVMCNFWWYYEHTIIHILRLPPMSVNTRGRGI